MEGSVQGLTRHEVAVEVSGFEGGFGAGRMLKLFVEGGLMGSCWWEEDCTLDVEERVRRV